MVMSSCFLAYRPHKFRHRSSNAIPVYLVGRLYRPRIHFSHYSRADHQFLPKSFHDIEILLAGVNRDLDVLIKQFRHGLGWWGMLQHLSKPAATPEVNVSHIRERWTAVRDDFTLYIRRVTLLPGLQKNELTFGLFNSFLL